MIIIDGGDGQDGGEVIPECDPLVDPTCVLGNEVDGGDVIPECDPLVDANCPVDGGEDVIIIEEEE